MDRLEPVLKQKFWILLGVAILMTFIGWWMATGAMAALIAQRQTDIENSFKSVPSGTIPNESWSKRLNAVNATQENSIKTTQSAMWKRQLAKMTWPEGVEPVNGYWEKFPNRMRELFRDSYVYEVGNVWKMLHPVEMDGSGVVLYPYQNMFKVLKKTSWPVTPPESEEMWQVQEDLWLLEGLFQSIAALNGGPDAGRGDAIIHQIDKLELRGGGDKVKAAGGGGGGGGGMPGGGGADSSAFGGGMMPMGAPAGYNPGGAGAAGGLAAGLAMVSAEFDPTEEFGEDGSGGGGGSMGMMSGMSMGAGEPAPTANAKPINRYLQPDDKAKPYKRRGFYLSVKMDHTKIPLLIEELTSNEKSVWPVEIVRVQMSRINEDDSTAGGGRRSQMMGLGAGAMPMPAAAGLMNGAGGNEEGFVPFGGKGNAGEVNSAARVAFENALKDPVMAQVTVAGIFTLYRKVDEPAASAPAAVPATPGTPEDAAPPESTTAEPTAADAAGAAGDKATAATEAAAGEPAMEADEPDVGKAEKSESIDAKPVANPDDKPEAKPGDKPEPKPEPNPDNPNQ